MPFITARVVSVIRADTGAAVAEAGADQSVLCASLVQLGASILGGDLADHTFEWEQTFGTPVTLINPNTLTPSFVNPQTTDIEFTFYLDRNTPFEDSDVVFISRGPQDSWRNTIGEDAPIKLTGDTARSSGRAMLPQFANVDAKMVADAYSFPPPTYTPIFTADGLDKVRNDLLGKYWLMNDIDLSGYSNWDPIGTQLRPFTGEFQGNGYVIDNMTITDRVRNSGLFGHANSGALIEKLGVTNADVSGQTSSWYSSILVGSTASQSGGLDGGTLTIRDCYTSGTVDSGTDRAGGLIGYTGTNASTLFENTYADVTVTGGGTRTGGWCGWWELEIATGIENYWNSTKTTAGFGSAGDTPGGTEVSGLTTAQLNAQTNYTGWDFTTIWEINEGVSPATLQEQNLAKNNIIRGFTKTDYMISWNRPVATASLDAKLNVGWEYAGAYIERLSGTTWVDKIFYPPESNNASVTGPNSYRLTTLWESTARGIIRRPMEIVHAEGLTTPIGKPFVTEVFSGLLNDITVSGNLVITIQNPRKISKNNTENIVSVIGERADSSSLVLTRFDGAPKVADTENITIAVGITASSASLTITRNNGASIG